MTAAAIAVVAIQAAVMPCTAAIFLTACCATANPLDNVRTGDLIFVAEKASEADSMSEAIASATGSFVHVAILERADDGSIMVIDATPGRGVDHHPLDTLFADFDGDAGHYRIMRLCGSSEADAQGYAQRAKAWLGEPYDFYYQADNGRHYCSELVYDAYSDGDSHIFEAVPMNFLDSEGHLPAYWAELFESLGCEVPQGAAGTNPNDMSASQRLVTIAEF